jgi:glycosyltransferase involved in cell wall biosynthesis
MTLRLGKALQAIGYAVTLVTVTDKGEWFERILEEGLSAISIPGKHQTHPYIHAIRTGHVLRDFDVVILAKYTGSDRCAQAAIRSLSDDTVAIQWIHSSTEEAYRQAYLNQSSWNVAVTVCEAGLAIANKFARRRSIVHIPNGVCRQSESQPQLSRDASSSCLSAVYLGRLVDYPKQILLLAKIIRQCIEDGVPIFLNVIGDGPDAAALQRSFERENVQEHVIMHGQLEHSDVFDHLSTAHVLFLPSITEAMPCAVMESQLCGCVPIATNISGVTDSIIRDGENGFLVDCGDIRGFANAVSKIHNDRDMWTQMSQSATRTSSKYTVEEMAHRFDLLITECRNGEWPLPKSRRGLSPIDLSVFRLNEAIPRRLRQPGLRTLLRRLSGRGNQEAGAS